MGQNQESFNVDQTGFWLSGPNRKAKNGQTIAQIGGRATPLVRYTLMAFNALTKMWAPFNSVAAAPTTGLNWPEGIYDGPTITAAALVAGNVTNVEIVVRGDSQFDRAKLVIEGGLTLDTVCSDGRSVSQQLADKGLFPRAVTCSDVALNYPIV